MLTCKQHTAEEFKNLNDEQCEAMAKIMTDKNIEMTRAQAESSILQEVIYELTGLDSIDAVIKVFGRDIVEEITVVAE